MGRLGSHFGVPRRRGYRLRRCLHYQGSFHHLIGRHRGSDLLPSPQRHRHRDRCRVSRHQAGRVGRGRREFHRRRVHHLRLYQLRRVRRDQRCHCGYCPRIRQKTTTGVRVTGIGFITVPAAVTVASSISANHHRCPPCGVSLRWVESAVTVRIFGGVTNAISIGILR